jgi:hypothetical protein
VNACATCGDVKIADSCRSRLTPVVAERYDSGIEVGAMDSSVAMRMVWTGFPKAFQPTQGR